MMLTEEQRRKLHKAAQALGMNLERRHIGACPSCGTQRAEFTGATIFEVLQGEVDCDYCMYARHIEPRCK